MTTAGPVAVAHAAQTDSGDVHAGPAEFLVFHRESFDRVGERAGRVSAQPPKNLRATTKAADDIAGRKGSSPSLSFQVVCGGR